MPTEDPSPKAGPPVFRALFRPAAVCSALLAAPLSRGDGTGVSSAFVFDARYGASGLSPALWTPESGSGVSDSFTLDMRGLQDDSDDDGMPDFYEIQYGLDPERNDADEDLDGDGVTNLEEYNAGTDPSVAEGGSGTGGETGEGPTFVGVSGAFVTDTRILRSGEGTGVGPDFAIVRVSSAFVCDTRGTLGDDQDGDGLPDAWEELYSGSKTGLDASGDADGDGRTALQEFVSGTDPTDPDSFFSVAIVMEGLVSGAASPGTGGALEWETAGGRVYKVYAKDSLSDDWSAAPVAVVAGDGGTASFPFDPDSPARFFQVTVELVPAD